MLCRSVRLLPAVFLLLSLFSSAYAQDTTAQENAVLENTLLWRIEGKGLAAPSYLYGTCHVEDARVFRFSDSVLPALGRCSTVATELRLDSIMWQIFTRLSSVDSTFDLKVELDEQEYTALQEMFQQRFGLPLDNYRHINPSVFRLILEWMETGEKSEGSEPSWEPENDGAARRNFFLTPGTFLDAWISRYGRLHRKEVIGLETYQEQLDAHDTTTLAERVRQTLSGYTATQSEEEGEGLEPLLDIYAANDIEAIERMRVRMEQQSPAYYRVMLVGRNHTMLRRMIDLMDRTTLFTAVGVLHLPGPDGLIALLRNAGYTVTPVMPVYSNKYPKLPLLPSISLPWDSGSIRGYRTTARFAVPTPSFTSPFWSGRSTDSERLTMAMAMDIETGMTYTVFVSSLERDAVFTPRDSILKGILNGIVDRKTFSVRSITIDGMPGMEIAGSNVEGKLIRARAVIRERDLYLLTVQGGTGMLSSRDPDRFFASLRFGSKPERNSLTTVSQGIAVRMGGETSVDTTRWLSGAMHRIYRVTEHAAESPLGTSYRVAVVRLSAEELPLAEHALADDLLAQNIDTTGAVVRYRALKPSGGLQWIREMRVDRSGSGPWITRRVLLREGRALVFTTIRSAPAAATAREEAFFDSLVITPAAGLVNSDIHFAQANCGATFPTPPEQESETAPRTMIAIYPWRASDEIRAESWSGRSARRLVAIHASPYLQVSDPDSLLRESRQGIVRGDSVRSEQIVEEAGIRWRELLIIPRTAKSSEEKPEEVIPPGVGARHVRIGVHGSTVYILTFLNLDGPDSARARAFFGSFNLINPVPQGDLRTSKTSRLIEDLTSVDTTTRARAIAATAWYRFVPEDLPAVYAACRQSYPDDTAGVGSYALWSLIWSAFSDTSDAQSVSELYATHTRLPQGNGVHGAIIIALGHIGTTEALDTLLLLLPTDSLHAEYADQILSALLYNNRSLDPLYPGLARYVDSAKWKRTVLWATRLALDSGRVSTERLAPETERVRSAAAEYLLPRQSSLNQFEVDEFSKSGRRPQTFNREVEDWELANAAALLGYFPLDEESERALRRGLDGTNRDLTRTCAVSLLRNGKSVDGDYLQTLAADPVQRIRLYTRLEHFGLLSHFPRKFATQQSIGEGVIAGWILEEQELSVDAIEHVEVQPVEYRGKPMRAHLYRYRYDEEGSWYPALILQPATPTEVEARTETFFLGSTPLRKEPSKVIATLLEQMNEAQNPAP